MTTDEEFAAQVTRVTDGLTALADAMANDGLLVSSGIVLGGRQAIRSLWTRLGVLETELESARTPPMAAPKRPRRK
ncbi:MAG: hypothetical protein LC640_09115 [Frankia sp.]|nr:hypothetical protein [Frankia sp.]